MNTHTFRVTHSLTLRRAMCLLGLMSAIGLAACGGDETQGGTKWDTTDDTGNAQPGDSDMGTSTDQGPSTGDLGTSNDQGTNPGDVAPPIPSSIETVVSALQIRSGETLDVSCEILDQYGVRIEEDALSTEPQLSWRATPEEVLNSLGDGTFEGVLVGTSRVTCSSRAFGLTDTSPAEVTVTPGVPHRTVAQLSARTTQAGDAVQGSCKVYDIHDNLISDAMPRLSANTMGDGIDVQGDVVIITRAGDYTFTCEAGAEPERVPASLEVTPALPAALTIERNPMQEVYGIGQVITILTYITDIYGNVITDAPAEFISNPTGEDFGGGRLRYFNEGTYDVVVNVTGPTHDNAALTASTQIVVNGLGPEINCTGPADGEQVNASPGSQVIFRGTLADTNGVKEVFVNGVPATLNADGTFEAPITTRYGVNFVDVTARDDFNVENSRTCAFQLSDRWSAPGTLEGDALMLKLRQPAVDDNQRGGPISSLADLLHTVLNSAGLVDTLDNSLIAAGPVESGNTTKLYDDSCATRILFICVVARVWYRHDTIAIDGPNTTSLTLLQDGLNIKARIEKIRLDVRVNAAGIIDTTGEVEVEFLAVDLTSDLKYENGSPRVTLRQINSTSIGDVDTDFNGIDGWIVNLLIDLFQGTVGDLLKDQLEGFVNTQFNGVLDDLVSGLDVNSLGTTLNIPKLDATGDIPLTFNVNFSSLTATSNRALFGLGASFDGPVVKGINSRGAAIPSGPTYLDPSITKPAGVAIHVTVINQVLHALWRGGFFDGTLGASTLGQSVPAGTQVTLATGMPPMLVLKGGTKADLHIGAMSLAIVYPGVFDEPLNVTLGATAKTSILLQGDNLSFTNITLDEFYFTAPGVTLDETTRDVLESFLKNLVQKIVDSSLNNALPALPIPSFTMPASLAAYGLPMGAELGVYNPLLDGTQKHFVLEGDFGIR